MRKDSKKLIEALEKLLSIAKNKLDYAIAKNNEWDIEHYKKDIEFIESELELIKQ
jgi:hypothetical protein